MIKIPLRTGSRGIVYILGFGHITKKVLGDNMLRVTVGWLGILVTTRYGQSREAFLSKSKNSLMSNKGGVSGLANVVGVVGALSDSSQEMGRDDVAMARHADRD